MNRLFPVIRPALDARYPEGTTYVEDDAHARTVALLPDGRAEAWSTVSGPFGDLGIVLEAGGGEP